MPKKTIKEGDKKILESLPEEFKEDKYIEVGARPWGVYYVLEDSPNYKVKKIVVNPGHRLSLQLHKHRSEHWIVVSGNASVVVRNCEDEAKWSFDLPPNESCFIPMNVKHRLANFGKIPLVIVEVQVGEYTGEDDIERFEDDYSRASGRNLLSI
ncbi:mannose-6-phosphate isomerase [Candidatus Gracilibacteria bacterium]|nr:mannose-6-phosphate isomerase [Candidatus Gracilibacteria bacterium]NJS41390.1 mannose-6-phosphate isomerase [Candidatus Gracilibacteria bacterium]